MSIPLQINSFGVSTTQSRVSVNRPEFNYENDCLVIYGHTEKRDIYCDLLLRFRLIYNIDKIITGENSQQLMRSEDTPFGELNWDSINSLTGG